jgi:hypothetical protein
MSTSELQHTNGLHDHNEQRRHQSNVLHSSHYAQVRHRTNNMKGGTAWKGMWPYGGLVGVVHSVMRSHCNNRPPAGLGGDQLAPL